MRISERETLLRQKTTIPVDRATETQIMLRMAVLDNLPFLARSRARLTEPDQRWRVQANCEEQSNNGVVPAEATK